MNRPPLHPGTVFQSLIPLLALLGYLWAPALGQAAVPPRIHLPRLEAGDLTRGAIFWFGRVDTTHNYADVRMGYDDRRLLLAAHIFDRLLWYDPIPLADTPIQADALVLYLQPAPPEFAGDGQSGHRYRFTVQLHNQEMAADYQAAAVDDGSGWMSATVPFTSTVGWRGNGFNDLEDDRGGLTVVRVPFAGLGLNGPPEGRRWRLGLALYDRDGTADGESPPSVPQATWPAGLDPAQPETWGEIYFGPPPAYTPPAVESRLAAAGQTVIRQGLGDVVVSDAAVGGGTDCGAPFQAAGFFAGWGDASYPGEPAVNIQNQWDVADWPCFSRYYITFPLDPLPAGKVILSATLTLHLFGNAGYAPDQAAPSWIQVATVGQPWAEETLTWNNGPPVQENVAVARVDPLPAFPGWPGVPVRWDVSRAVAAAYADRQPLRLVLYAADGAYHSGKYFSSSDVPDWNETARPTLAVWWGEPACLRPVLFLPHVDRRMMR